PLGPWSRFALPVRMRGFELLQLVVDLRRKVSQRLLRALLAEDYLVAGLDLLVREERRDRRRRRRNELVFFEEIDPGLHQRNFAVEVVVECDFLDRRNVVL